MMLIINGVNMTNFPSVPVDYGYRDNKIFWYTKFRKPVSEPIPASKGIIKSILIPGVVGEIVATIISSTTVYILNKREE